MIQTSQSGKGSPFITATDQNGENITKPSICIIAHNAYGAMLGGMAGHIGGAEHQTALLAKWLAGRGYPTSLLTWDEGQSDDCIIDGVRVIGISSAEAGVPGLRFFHPRTTGLFAAMRRANANIYYQNSAENVTGLAAAWCQWCRRVFIYSVASDVACERKLPAMRGLRDRLLYRYGLRHATRIIVQTHRQENLIKESFGLDSMPLPMPCRLPVAVRLAGNAVPPEQRVAWVGRVVPLKRMEWLLDIAARMPDVEFDVAGANMEDAMRSPHLAGYASHLNDRAKTMRNVTWHGAVSREDVINIYCQAFCLCCTSEYEGFPNTFLEAWSQGRPTISSFDPDGLIQSRNLGSYASTVDDFVSAIRRLLSSPDEWLRQSRNCLEYYATNHALDIAMPRFEREIVEAYRSSVDRVD